MSDLPPKSADKYCNARKTDGSGYCQHTAGWGTDHTGTGRCKFHGGNTENHEKGIIADFEDATEHGAIAIRLQLKHIRQAIENGEEVDVQELDRLVRTAADRAGYGPTETREVRGEGENGEILIDFSDADT
jgi:hypothetical protein